MAERTAVVFDTTVLSNFSSIQMGMGYLTQTINYPVTARKVYEELKAGYDDGIHFVESALDCIETERPPLETQIGLDIPEGKIHAESLPNRAVAVILENHLESDKEYGGLDLGEAHALCICDMIRGSKVIQNVNFHDYNIRPILATDDMAARDAADEIGIDFIGSIGLLVRGVKRGDFTLNMAENWHTHWVERLGFYSPVEKVADELPDDGDY